MFLKADSVLSTVWKFGDFWADDFEWFLAEKLKTDGRVNIIQKVSNIYKLRTKNHLGADLNAAVINKIGRNQPRWALAYL